MTRALDAFAAALCCAVLLSAAAHPDNGVPSGVGVEVAETTPGDDGVTAEEGGEVPADGDGDSAPFTLVVEHADGQRCSASLVSLRTAVTSARCARGTSPSPTSPPHSSSASDVWVHAPPAAAPHSSRRVARVVLTVLAAQSETADDSSWSDADVAVLELEAPLGGHARAILMATSGAECTPPAACHVVRARTHVRTRTRTTLRIVDEALVPTDACDALVPRHSAAARRLLCLRGDTLCPSDWGAGVVCEGKLCGVVSQSAWEEEGRRGEECGAIHAAAAVARYRRFLHCAHTPRACRRGGECADLCTERRLLDDDEAQSRESPPAPPTLAAPAAALALRHHGTTTEHGLKVPHRTSDVTKNLERVSSCTHAVVLASAASTSPRRPAPTRTPAPPPAPPSLAHSPRPAPQFEPNRPDFKDAPPPPPTPTPTPTPTRTSRVYLKAGEYGDNAAEYDGDESAPAPAPVPAPAHAPAPASATTVVSSPSPGPGPAAPRHEVSAPAPAPAHESAPVAATPAALVVSLLYFTM